MGNDNFGATYVFEQDGLGNWLELAKLADNTFSSGADFGNRVAISRAILVGTQNDAELGNSAGAAYAYKFIPEPATAALLVIAGMLVSAARR